MTDYNHSTAAFALLFKNKYNNALRVEVPGIAMEFTDGLYIGRDPEGFLHYNNVDDLKQSGTHYYDVSKAVNDDGITCCVIQFRCGSTTATPYAKFIAEDPADTVYGTGMSGHSGKGQWGSYKTASSSAIVTKSSSGQDITITADPVTKVGTWTSPSDILNKTGFNIEGILYFRKLSDLGKAKWANYNDDRIVFYQNDYTGTDFTAFFIPLECNVTTLQVFPVDTVTFSKVSWK